MLYYQFYFRGHGRFLMARFSTRCFDDEAAINAALGRLARSSHSSVEVWENGRKLYVSPQRFLAKQGHDQRPINSSDV